MRFEVAVKSYDPALKIIAPAREWNLSREEEIQYAEEHGIPVPVDLGNPYSVDQNLWGRSIECGALENPETEPPQKFTSGQALQKKLPTSLSMLR